MSQVSQLSPELARGVLQLARALLVAARNWTRAVFSLGIIPLAYL